MYVEPVEIAMWATGTPDGPISNSNVRYKVPLLLKEKHFVFEFDSEFAVKVSTESKKTISGPFISLIS